MKATLYKTVFGQQDIYTTFEGNNHNELISKARAYYNKAGLIGRFYLDIESETYQIT